MRRFVCAGCGRESHPSFELHGNGKLVARCPKADCGSINAQFGPEHFATAAVCVEQASAPGQAGRMEFRDLDPATEALKPTAPSFGKLLTPSVLTTPQPPPIAPAAAAAMSFATAPPSPGPRDGTEPFDPVPALQARRAFLEVEIAKLDNYKRELKRVSKMLAIAYSDAAKDEQRRAIVLEPIGQA